MSVQMRMNLILKALATAMRARRKTLGLTQEQLAEKSGLSPNYVARLELADRMPSLKTVVRLAAAPEVEAHELLGVHTERPWLSYAEEVERVMASLEEEDARFALGECQHVAQYIREVRKAST